MSFFTFFSPFFIFWDSLLLTFIIEMLCPTLIVFSLVRIIGGIFDV